MSSLRGGGGRLLYDGDCGFCTRTVRWAQRRVQPDVCFQDFRITDLGGLGVSYARLEREMVLARPDGAVLGGARAATALLSAGRWPWPVLGVVLRLPGVRALADAGYRAVAANRQRLPTGSAACSLQRHE